MSDKPDLKVVPQTEDTVLEERMKDPEFKAKVEAAKEDAAQFDVDERAAYLLHEEYPKLLMNRLKNMAKDKPNALARVIFNELLYPLESVDLITKEEKELSKFFSEILAAKRQVFMYSEKRKAEKALQDKTNEVKLDTNPGDDNGK